MNRENAEAEKHHTQSHNALVGVLSQLIKNIGVSWSGEQEKSGNAGSIAGGDSNPQDTGSGVSIGGAGEVDTPGHQEEPPTE